MSANAAAILANPKPAWLDQEDVNMFDHAVRGFLEKECLPHGDRWEKEGVVDREIWTKAGEAGLLCPAAPEEFGGAGGDWRHDYVFHMAVAELGVDGWGASLHNSIVAPYVWHYGTQAQKEKLLPKLISGEYVGAIAMTEPGAGSDLQGVKTTAVKDGNGYRINGSKTFITNGGTANFIVLVAKTDPKAGAKGTSLFLVETDHVEGFRRGRVLDKVGLKAQDTAELFFDDMWVPSDALLGEGEGLGFIQLMEQLPQERLQIAVQGVGMMKRALAETIAYVAAIAPLIGSEPLAAGVAVATVDPLAWTRSPLFVARSNGSVAADRSQHDRQRNGSRTADPQQPPIAGSTQTAGIFVTHADDVGRP